MGSSLVIIAVVFGLIFGSAINALVWRINVGKSWAKGRSQCSDCGHELAPADLVPVLSWILLRGKCRYCHRTIKDHPIVELVTAIVFGLSAYVIAPVNTVGFVILGFWLLCVVLLLTLAVYDARWMILPDKVMVPTIAVAIVSVTLTAVLTRSPQVALGAFEAAVVAGSGFYAIVLFTRGRAMGGGDIKLAFAMGLLLGIQGTAVAMLVAFNVAAIVGVTLIITKRASRRDQLPFGPYLVAGTIVAFLYGRSVVSWYLRINGIG